MAWTVLDPSEPELKLKTNGVIEWNMAFQAQLADPKWVRVLWDSDTRRLGVRANYITEGFPVYSELDHGEFKIDSGDTLDAAGVSVDSNYADTPTRLSDPLVGSEGALYNPEPVWYITLP